VKKARSRRQTNSLSPEERQRREEQRRASVRRLLYSREQTAEVLGGISIPTIIRLENEGRLSKVRLHGVTSKVFHKVEEVEALASGGQAND